MINDPLLTCIEQVKDYLTAFMEIIHNDKEDEEEEKKQELSTVDREEISSNTESIASAITYVPKIAHNTKFDDTAFRGICVSEMIDITIAKGPDQSTSELQSLRDEYLPNFLKLYSQHRSSLESYRIGDNTYLHPLFELFKWSEQTVKRCYYELWRWFVTQITDNFDKLSNKKKRKKFEGELFENVHIYIGENLKPIKHLWTLQLSCN